MSTQRVSIALPEEDDGIAGVGAFRVLESFATAADAAIQSDVRWRVGRAITDFPELVGTTVTVARLDPSAADTGTRGEAEMLNRIIYLPAERRSSFQTVYHELGHLAIEILNDRGEDVPTTSEAYCSIFSVARMPPAFVERPTISYLGEPSVPNEEWPEICKRALAYREEHHDYIKQACEWLEIEDDD